MEGTKVCLEHPDRRVEPLEGSDHVDKQDVPRMPECYMCLLVCQDMRVAALVILTGNHDVFHPAERSCISFCNYERLTAFKCLPASVTDDSSDADYRNGNMYKHRQCTENE